jgi:hypothetical protein
LLKIILEISKFAIDNIGTRVYTNKCKDKQTTKQRLGRRNMLGVKGKTESKIWKTNPKGFLKNIDEDKSITKDDFDYFEIHPISYERFVELSKV